MCGSYTQTMPYSFGVIHNAHTKVHFPFSIDLAAYLVVVAARKMASRDLWVGPLGTPSLACR